DVPVDLAPQHHPPLVVMVVVRVVGLTGWMADQEGLDVVGQHQCFRPGRLAFLGDQVGQAALPRRAGRRRLLSIGLRACTSSLGKSSTMATKSAPKIKRWKSTQRTVRY